MLGLKKQFRPLVADGHQTLATARDQLEAMVWLALATLAVSLLTLAVVLHSAGAA